MKPIDDPSVRVEAEENGELPLPGRGERWGRRGGVATTRCECGGALCGIRGPQFGDLEVQEHPHEVAALCDPVTMSVSSFTHTPPAALKPSATDIAVSGDGVVEKPWSSTSATFDLGNPSRRASG